MKAIHVIAGLLALASGAVALVAAKGSKPHRRSGQLFAAAMLVMSSTAAVMAIFGKRSNVVGGALTFYLVSTGVLAVRRSVARGLVIGLMLVALAASGFGYALVLEAVRSPSGTVDGVAPEVALAMSTVGLLAALGDVRLLWRERLDGRRRLARHLWRMTFGQWIAAGSFFLGQPRVFPAFLRAHAGLRALPVALTLVMMCYWLIRVRLVKRLPSGDRTS